MAEPRTKTRLLRLLAESTAGDVLQRLRTAPGVDVAEWQAPGLLALRYDLRLIDLQALVEMLAKEGVNRPPSFWRRCWFGLLVYAEAVEREAMDADPGWDNSVRRIYLTRHRTGHQGRREERPQHWQQYLQKP